MSVVTCRSLIVTKVNSVGKEFHGLNRVEGADETHLQDSYHEHYLLLKGNQQRRTNAERCIFYVQFLRRKSSQVEDDSKAIPNYALQSPQASTLRRKSHDRVSTCSAGTLLTTSLRPIVQPGASTTILLQTFVYKTIRYSVYGHPSCQSKRAKSLTRKKCKHVHFSGALLC